MAQHHELTQKTTLHIHCNNIIIDCNIILYLMQIYSLRLHIHCSQVNQNAGLCCCCLFYLLPMGDFMVISVYYLHCV